MSFFSTPGSSTITLTSPLVVITSTRGSLFSLTSMRGLPIRVSGLTLPNSLTLGFPSGPIVTLYPYTKGPHSFTLVPSGSVRSRMSSLGAFLESSLNSLSIISSISLKTSSIFPKLLLKKGLLLNHFDHQSSSDKTHHLLFLLI